MDPFAVRMDFNTMLTRLDASQASLMKVVGFALKHASRCSDDLWDCLLEECAHTSLNARINILYLIDALCETVLRIHAGGSGAHRPYVDLVAKDVQRVVDMVVPKGREGLINLLSTRQILDSWRAKRVLEPDTVDKILLSLVERSAETVATVSPTKRDHSEAFSRDDVFKRIEEDRVRHKLLRQRRWVQPVSNTAGQGPWRPAAFSIGSAEDALNGSGVDPIDVEFENAWETTSDWNEDDDEAAHEENNLCFRPEEPRAGPTDTDSFMALTS